MIIIINLKGAANLSTCCDFQKLTANSKKNTEAAKQGLNEILLY
jgi:hypothetical protein